LPRGTALGGGCGDARAGEGSVRPLRDGVSYRALNAVLGKFTTASPPTPVQRNARPSSKTVVDPALAAAQLSARTVINPACVRTRFADEGRPR